MCPCVCVEQFLLVAAVSWMSCRMRCYGKQKRRSNSSGKRRRRSWSTALTHDPVNTWTWTRSWTSCRSKVTHVSIQMYWHRYTHVYTADERVCLNQMWTCAELTGRDDRYERHVSEAELLLDQSVRLEQGGDVTAALSAVNEAVCKPHPQTVTHLCALHVF